MPWGQQDVELWRRAKLTLGLETLRDAVRQAERSVRASEGAAPSLSLAENEAFRIALRAELEARLGAKGD
jgi:hypothetical protein